MTTNNNTSYVSLFVIVLCLGVIACVIIRLYLKTRYEKFSNMKVIDIVVARYAEPIEWLCSKFFGRLCASKNDVIINLYIYNKGASFQLPNCIPENVNIFMHQLRNVGRCDHTYLYHICKKYENLADVTIFLPGSCDMESKAERTVDIMQRAFTDMHTAMVCQDVGDVKKAFYDFQLDEWLSSNQMNKHNNQDPSMELSNIRPFGKWFEHVFGTNTITRCVNWFGILAVSKTNVLYRSLEFYQRLLAMLDNHNNPEVGHYIERSWYAIFNP